MINKKLLLAITAITLSQSGMAADANAGKAFFKAQCGLCHSAEANDNGGAQGPGLQGVFGRKAATNEQFSYTEVLKKSGLSWDAVTLDRFLTNPTAAVPGSAMVIAVPAIDDRANVIAYFQALKEGTFKEAQRPAFAGGPPPGAAPPPPAAVPAGDPDWKKDAPGRVHKVDVATLPAPYATTSANNFPRLIPKPVGAELKLPKGFKVDVYTKELTAPRAMTVAPNGDIFISETQTGRVKVMRPSADGSKPAKIDVFAQGLLQPLGIAFYPAGDKPQWVYVAETNRVVRYAYNVGDSVAKGVPEVVVPQLSPKAGGGHYTRDIAFSPDGKRMFVSVGSMSNVPEDLPKKTPEEIKAWEAAHGVGAAWGNEENRADVLAFEVGSNKPGKIFATGIRNCVGLTVQPATGALWCTTNERDMLGDDLVPDYSTRVTEGGFYGWPWYYMGKYEDPRFAGQRSDLAGKAIVPDVRYTAHSASVDLEFYPKNVTGSSAFPAEYAGDGFAVLHGSWNRGQRTGHKIVRLPMKDGVPTGEYIDFMVGFIGDDGNPWGRPVATVVTKDGSMLVSDDGANVVYRISYSK